MKFSQEKPPNWNRLEKAFGVKWPSSVVVAYGGTVHHTQKLHPSVIVHESVHLARQKDPTQWWESYIRDPKFRFSEELLAYREQFKYLKDITKDRNEVARHLFRLASELSGSMYRLPITHQEALKLIKME